MTKSKLYPQFLHTLDPEFHTHLTIPVDFFLKYIQGRDGKGTAKLKSDSSDITWQVKMTGRRLSSGWKEFSVAHDLQIGNVVAVRYEGDMVFHVSDLGPNSRGIRDIPAPSINNDRCDQNNVDNPLLKKNLHPRTQADDGDGGDNYQDNIELPRKKKVKTIYAETISSSPDNYSFVALVTALNLRTDTLYLPQHLTSSNGLTIKCREIVLTDEGKRSWRLNLRFNKSSDTFYISPGWRNFCEENGEQVGGFFMFKLVANGETPVLSFCPTESIIDRRQRECLEASRRKSLFTKHTSEEENIEEASSEDESSSSESLMEIEKKKCRQRKYSSYSPMHKQFVTFTLPPDYVRIGKLSLPLQFIRENGINKPGEIYLLGKDGTKQLVYLALDKKGTMTLGKGWKDFVKANSLEKGFMLKLIWEDTTPVLSLCCAESGSDRGKEEFSEAIKKRSLATDPSNRDKISKDENNKESSSLEREKNHPRWINSTPSSQKEIVRLTITPFSVRRCRLNLPVTFTRENDINKPGMIILLGKDGMKQQTSLLFDKEKRRMYLGNGWKDFVAANGLKTGDSFTLKLIWEGTIPVLSLCSAECSGGRRAGGDCLEACTKESLPIEPSSGTKIIKDDNSKEEKNIEENSKEKSSSGESEKNPLRCNDSTSPNQSRFVTLTPTHNSLRKGRQYLPKQFMRENSMNEPGTITLSGKDGTKWLTALRVDKQGTIRLVNGWKEFAEANGLKVGQSFTLESTWEDATPMLSLICTESTCDRKQQDECSKASEKGSMSTEARRRDSSSGIQNRFVTLTLTHEDVRGGKLNLPSKFMRANGINKLGKITLLGKDGLEWLGYLLSKDGTVSLGCGWKDFCEANGVKTGETFTLEFVYVKDTNLVLKFCSQVESPITC